MNMNEERKMEAHRYFAADCFNRIWEILDKVDRDPGDIEKMIHLAHASFWHWTQISDATATNLSVGYWMLSRVYVMAMDDMNALIYANKCLDVTIENDLEPFSLAYGYEAFSRALKIAGDIEKSEEYRIKGIKTAELILDLESKNMVLADLENIVEESNEITE